MNNNQLPTQEPQSSQAAEENNTPVVSPIEPAKPLLANKKVLTIGLLLLAVVCGGVLYKVFGSPNSGDNDPKITVTDQQSQFQNWLQPKEEIKVSNFRYVSTCQALNTKDVEDIFGKLDADDTITEEYLDFSVDGSEQSHETRCSYGDRIEIFATQYTDQQKVKQLSRSVYSLGASEMAKKIQAFESASASSSDQKIKDFVANLKRSTDFYNQNKNQFSKDKLQSLSTDGLVVPVTGNVFGFNIFQGNVVYRLEFDTGLKSSQQYELPAEKMNEYLSQVAKASDKIIGSTKNTKLDQSPAPTILGTTDKIGQTSVLESCAILTDDVFKSATGRDQNSVIRRTTAPVDIGKKRYAKVDKIELLPRNSCDRKNSITSAAGGSDNVTMRFELQMAESQEAATALLTKGKYIPLDSNDAELQTKADWAAEKLIEGFDDPYYIFRVGPYIGIVSLTTLNSGGLGDPINQGQATREQHAAAINAVVDSLKSNLSQVK